MYCLISIHFCHKRRNEQLLFCFFLQYYCKKTISDETKCRIIVNIHQSKIMKSWDLRGFLLNISMKKNQIKSVFATICDIFCIIHSNIQMICLINSHKISTVYLYTYLYKKLIFHKKMSKEYFTFTHIFFLNSLFNLKWFQINRSRIPYSFGYSLCDK